MNPSKTPTPKAEKITYGSATITLHTRANGYVALSWIEAGRRMRTTRAGIENARAWAKKHVRQLDSSTGAKYVSPLAAERLAWLERIAGTPDSIPRILSEIEDAHTALSGRGTIRDAVAWYLLHGPPAVTHHMTFSAAIAAFLSEYETHHPSETVRPVRAILNLAARSPCGKLPLLEITHAHLAPIVRSGSPADRTVRNRIACFVTFFRRAENLEWWPAGKRHPAATLKRPRKVDKVPEIYHPTHATHLLRWASQNPQHLPFLLIAGWLGVRPAECVRITWSDFDFPHSLLHIRPEVARKKNQERWIPIDPILLPILKKSAATAKSPTSKACRFHSRARLSEAARENPAVAIWIPDGLRHSFITYRLQILQKIDTVAEEAGNSPSEIRQSYRRPIPPKQGIAWWKALKILSTRRR